MRNPVFHNNAAKKYQQKKLAAGLCCTCGKRKLHTKHLCKKCAKKAYEARKRKK